MTRPPPPLRIAILIAAIACLGLAMCARTEHARRPAAPASPVSNQAPPTRQAQPAPPPPPRPDAAVPEPVYFNATKAPGGMYR